MKNSGAKRLMLPVIAGRNVKNTAKIKRALEIACGLISA
jgi:hypothetical protein